MKDGAHQKWSTASFRVRFVSVIVLGLTVFGSVFALAQGIVTGSISAVVQDPQGAVVAGAGGIANVVIGASTRDASTLSAGAVRAPVYLGLRDDRDPRDVVREDVARAG